MNIMNLLKEHRYEFVCVALALLLILSLWPALMLGADARTKASEAQKLFKKIEKLQGRGSNRVANPAMVQASKQRAKQAKLEARQVADQFRKRNRRKFLIPGLFPQVRNLWSFKGPYEKEIDKLYVQTLRAGWPEEDADAYDEKGPSHIGMYVEKPKLLGIPKWIDKAEAPSPEDCWFGQLSLWIQQDLAEIFRDMNLASARQRNQPPSVTNAAIKRIIAIQIDDSYYQADRKTSVGIDVGGGFPGMPGLYDPLQGIDPGQSSRPGRRGQIIPFTERTSNKTADVLHFSFYVIVDSRRINELLDALSRKNLYTILNVSLSREDLEINKREFKRFETDRAKKFNPYKDAAQDLVYGTDPIVRLDVDAEILFLRELYGKDTPEQIKETWGRTNRSPRGRR